MTYATNSVTSSYLRAYYTIMKSMNCINDALHSKNDLLATVTRAFRLLVNLVDTIHGKIAVRVKEARVILSEVVVILQNNISYDVTNYLICARMMLDRAIEIIKCEINAIR